MARKKPAPRRMRGAPAAAAADPDHPTRRGAVLPPGGPLIGGDDDKNKVPPSGSGSPISVDGSLSFDEKFAAGRAAGRKRRRVTPRDELTPEQIEEARVGSPIFPSEPEWVVFRDGTRRAATVEELRRLAGGGSVSSDAGALADEFIAWVEGHREMFRGGGPGEINLFARVTQALVSGSKGRDLGTPEGRARAFVGPLLPVSISGTVSSHGLDITVACEDARSRDVIFGLLATLLDGPLLPVYGSRPADVLSELAGRGELPGPSDPRSGNHPARQHVGSRRHDPPDEPELCEDEGCPQAGSEHVCVTRVEDIPGLLLRLDMGTVASCTCGVKTPEVGYHGPMCRYRLLVEAAEVIRGFVSRGGASL